MAAAMVEGAAARLITIGAAEEFAMSLRRFHAPTPQKMQIWMHFATWLLVGLEFELARRCHPHSDRSHLAGHWTTGFDRRNPYVSQLLSRSR